VAALFNQKTATIANGATSSDAVYLGDKLPVALQMPAAFTGASVSFTGSYDGVTYQAVTTGSAATPYSEGVAASKFVTLDPSMFPGFRWMKIVSASAEGADRTILVSTRRGDR
jgi:hypothetical protein